MDTAETAAQDHYHHGNLRRALIESSLAVLKERGLAGFSMRDAARRAGVSQSAPKHHFGDARGLLGAVAETGYVQLCELLEAAPLAGLDAHGRVTVLASRYVAFARRNRALFDLMWRVTAFDIDDPAVLGQKRRAMRALERGVRGVRGRDADPEETDDATLIPSYAVWSLVHGYTVLALEGAIDDRIDDCIDDRIDDREGGALSADRLLPAMLRRLDLS